MANRCVLGVCIGHADDVTAVCESALDLTVSKTHQQLAMATLDAGMGPRASRATFVGQRAP